MSKITELRKYYNSKGTNYIYVKQSDYTLNPISTTEVEVLFKPEFWEYYGAVKYKLKNDTLSYNSAGINLNKDQLLKGYNKDRIRDLIREKFKSHIISYIERQKEIDDFDFDFDFDDNLENTETLKEESNSDEVFTDSFDFDEPDFPDFEEQEEERPVVAGEKIIKRQEKIYYTDKNYSGKDAVEALQKFNQIYAELSEDIKDEIDTYLIGLAKKHKFMNKKRNLEANIALIEDHLERIISSIL